MLLYGVKIKGTLAMIPCGTAKDKRLVSLHEPVSIAYHTDEGVHRFHIKRGFLWNGRSGGFIIDAVFPNQGSLLEAMMWLGHDAGAYPGTPSGHIVNDLLRQTAIIECGYSDKAAALIYGAVSSTCSLWKADEWDDVDPEYQCNHGKVFYEWAAK